LEGVVAPTSANNAAVAGAWIPALVFGIPGDAVTAIVLGALLMYDIKTGPLIFEQHPDQVHAIFMIALITQALLLPCGWMGIKGFGWLLRLPRQVVLMGVAVFSVVGAFALRNSLFDVWVMAGFGVVGFFLERQRVPLAPLILGLILGPMVEFNLRTGLIKSGGDFTPFVTRPISAVFVGVLALSLAGPWIWRWIRGGLMRETDTGNQSER
jgi:TctA family transporter